jgi:hypothetical protein
LQRYNEISLDIAGEKTVDFISWIALGSLHSTFTLNLETTLRGAVGKQARQAWMGRRNGKHIAARLL